MKTDGGPRCETCFYSTFIDSGYRNCQRYAPEPDDQRVDGYPSNPVPWDYFCGDYVQRLPMFSQEADE